MQDNKVFSVSFDKEFNHYTDEVQNEVYLRVYKTMFTSGLVAKMKLHNFATLMAIASYMNEKGECYPTQRQLADRMGVHRNSVNKYINQLLDFRIDGKPIITREIVNLGRGKVSSYYKIHPISQLAIFGGDVDSVTKDVPDSSQDTGQTQHKRLGHKNNQEEQPIKKNTGELKPKDLITLFVNKYREQYNVNYNPSWARDMAQMKKLKERYDDETLKEIIEIAVEDYESKWKSVKFPRPTIGAIVSFIGEQAQAVIEERRKEEEQFAKFEENEEQIDDKMNEKLDKLNRL